MRDEHRPKHELIHEITGLRKQVIDLKEAIIVRRRVEDALRDAESLLRSLTNGVPVGLGLVRRDGAVLMTNLPLARFLGYDSPAELQRIGTVLGIFASLEEQSRVLDSSRVLDGSLQSAVFRHKDGSRQFHCVMTAHLADTQAIALVVFDGLLGLPEPESATRLSAASSMHEQQ